MTKTSDEILTRVFSLNSTEEIQKIWNALRERHSQLQAQSLYTFRVGEKVRYKKRGWIGKITSIGRTMLAVNFGEDGQWRVSPFSVEKVGKLK